MLRLSNKVQRQHVIQLPRYLLVGGFATASHYGVFLLLIGLTGPLPASLAGALAGTLLSYLGNRRWTFAQNRSASGNGQLMRFAITALGYNLGNAVMMLLLLDHWPQSPLQLQLFCSASLTLMTYWTHRAWTFKHEPN